MDNDENFQRTKTKTQSIEHIYCPVCFTGHEDSNFRLVCEYCKKDIVQENDDILCIKRYINGNNYAHYHFKCYKKSVLDSYKKLLNTTTK